MGIREGRMKTFTNTRFVETRKSWRVYQNADDNLHILSIFCQGMHNSLLFCSRTDENK
jgi:hypothetical protein